MYVHSCSHTHLFKRKIFVSSPIISENKGKSKIIIYESFYGKVCRNTNLLTEKMIVDIYIDDIAKSRRKLENIG